MRIRPQGAGSIFDESVGIRHASDPVRTPQGQVETRYAIDPDAQVTGTTRVGSNGTVSNETTQATRTDETSERTAAGTGTAGSGTDDGVTETTGTSGPGFGIVAALVAVVVIGLFARRRR